MKKVIFTLLCLVQLIQIHAQQVSTTDIYTTSIDAVLEQNGLEGNRDLKLILAPYFYENNIKTYKGKHKLAYLTGFRNSQKEWAGKELIYLDLSPIKVSKSNLIVIVKKSTVTYKSRKNWTLNNENEKFYYTVYEYDKQKDGYNLKEVIEGRFCPDTVN